MKVRLLKRLRKQLRKEYILKSKYPGIIIYYWNEYAHKYEYYKDCYTSDIEKAKIILQEARAEKLKYLVGLLKDKQRDKDFKKL